MQTFPEVVNLAKTRTMQYEKVVGSVPCSTSCCVLPRSLRGVADPFSDCWKCGLLTAHLSLGLVLSQKSLPYPSLFPISNAGWQYINGDYRVTETLLPCLCLGHIWRIILVANVQVPSAKFTLWVSFSVKSQKKCTCLRLHLHF